MKLPIEDIYRGGNSKSRNPRMQTMLRMIGFGDNAGSGFPAILSTWEKEGWIKPELKEDTKLNQVTLTLKMMPVWLIELQETGAISTEEYESMDVVLKRLTAYMTGISKEQMKKIAEAAKTLSNNMPDNEKLTHMVQDLPEDLEKSAESAEKSAESAEKSAESAEKSAESAEKSAESAEKSAESAEKSAESAEKSAESAEKSAERLAESAESANSKVDMQELPKRKNQILACMQQGESYSTEEVAQMIGLKGSRTRQLLNELVEMGLVSCVATTKNRRYVKEQIVPDTKHLNHSPTNVIL